MEESNNLELVLGVLFILYFLFAFFQGIIEHYKVKKILKKNKIY
jgi:hypothetical protein